MADKSLECPTCKALDNYTVSDTPEREVTCANCGATPTARVAKLIKSREGRNA